MLARVHSCIVINLESAEGIEVEVDTRQDLSGIMLLGPKDRIVFNRVKSTFQVLFRSPISIQYPDFSLISY